ncbi:TetR family transcriptional regulator [Spongiactinospora rosea]|uniref:TetR family transcriptional regulator n=1 Tax=Spongiactinospora rosea TaxID=2248750 RepID=UPI0011C048D6|nr:TetR/AcrR family transcriptional regulator [Spongiactinospora rosea]
MAAEHAQESTPAQRRRDRQRRLIIREAALLFEENGGEEGGGFEKTTAEAIAERSDISVSTFFRYFKTKADVIYLDLGNAIPDHLDRVAAKLVEGRGLAEAWVEGTFEALDRFAADEYNRARILRAVRSPNFHTTRAVWTIRWNDQLTELLRDHLPESEDREFRARATAAVWLSTMWVAVEQWASVGLDRPLAPILRNALGLAVTAADQARDAVPPEHGTRGGG